MFKKFMICLIISSLIILNFAYPANNNEKLIENEININSKNDIKIKRQVTLGEGNKLNGLIININEIDVGKGGTGINGLSGKYGGHGITGDFGGGSNGQLFDLDSILRQHQG